MNKKLLVAMPIIFLLLIAIVLATDCKSGYDELLKHLNDKMTNGDRIKMIDDFARDVVGDQLPR